MFKQSKQAAIICLRSSISFAPTCLKRKKKQDIFMKPTEKAVKSVIAMILFRVIK